MKLKSKTRTICTCLLLMIATILAAVGISLIGTHVYAASADTQQEVLTLDSKQYEFVNDDSSNSYGFSSTKQVSVYSNGTTSLGTIRVQGDSLTLGTYNGVQAIGVNAGTTLTFSYKQTVSTNNYNSHEWKLSSDVATVIGGYSVGTIGNGAVIVLKSSDGIHWDTTGAKMVGINDKTFTFKPDGKDVGNGTYYKFLSAAEVYYTYVSGTHTEWVVWPFKKKTVTDYSNYYTNLGQETTAYVCANSPSSVSFTSQATSDYKYENDELTAEEISFVQKGVTLVDNSVSFSTITLNNLNNNCFDIYYSYNDGEYELITTNKKSFEAEGKYTFKVKTPLKVEKTYTMYIVHGNDDLAYSQYFATGLIDEKERIYDATKAVPVYMVGKQFSISPNSSFLPGMYGNVYYYKDDAALKENNYSIVQEFNGLVDVYTGIFDNEGYYIFDLYSSDPSVTSGEIVNYSFRLYIKDDADYAPSVNYDLLTATSRNELFVRKVYAVTLKTAGGGSFVYCFPYETAYYDLAYSVAENIELLSVEDYGDYYYYKSLTSNVKEKYVSKAKLFETIGTFASQNVSVLYFEANTEYLTQSADEETLRDLTKQSIEKDVCVVTNESVKKALQADEIYVNDFTFVQVADYESDVVMAVDEMGNQYKIPYGTSLSSIFTTAQKITITEENWCGRSVYSVIYYPETENKAEININVSDSLVMVNSGNVLDTNVTGNTISIVQGDDNYDSQSMIIISDSNGERCVMLLSEAAGYAFPNKDMTYEICIVNRFGVELMFSITVEKVDETLTSDKNSEELSGVGKIVEVDNVVNNVQDFPVESESAKEVDDLQNLSVELEITEEVTFDAGIADIDVNSGDTDTSETQVDNPGAYKSNPNVQSTTDNSMGQSANNKNTDSLSTGEIVGISIAASSFMLIMIGLAIKLIRRRFL